METKIIEKIDKAYEIIMDKIAKYNEKTSTFMADAFINDGVLAMLEVIEDTDWKGYSYKLDCGYFTVNTEGTAAIRYDDRNDAGYKTTFRIFNGMEKHYSDKYIEHLDSLAKLLITEYKYFQEVQDKAEDIINDITTKYKVITENQLDTLDGIFELLDVEEEPVKHIKVTVEWI